VSKTGRYDDDLERVFREEHGRVVATLVRHFGDIDVAEEAVQEAFLIALQRWPESGLPPNPGGWLTTTARNRAIDRIRRESSRDSRQVQAAMLSDPDTPEPSSVQDDRLRLIFTCCHPALAPDAQVALTLRLLCGLTAGEIVNELALTAYHPFHAARADLLRREGRTTEAVEAYTLAIDLSTNPAEKSYLRARRQDLQPR